MSDTVKLNPCPKCGAPIPAGAPQGLCPKCILLGAATATDTGVPATATSEIPSLERVAAAFPQLEILELIGRGGMGFVFKARQPRLDRFVALKLLPDKLARDPRFAERFNREGRVLAKLNHPNIVSVFDFGQTEHFYFLMMEYVDGVNLRQAMQAGRFSPAEALAIVPKICEALQYAHGQGILHRDIKPENILLDARGQVKIADFGIAKLVGEEKPDVSLTATGAALGTPHYMAPEQFEKPAEVDHRADIYSLGVVFYEMLTGELPIGRFAAPSSKTPVGANVDEVVFRTLEKDRERRYQSAGEMQTQVEHLTDAGADASSPAPSKLPGADAVVAKWSQKAVWGAVLTGLSVPLPVVVLAAYVTKGGRAMVGGWELLLVAVTSFVPGLVGTLLGWMAMSDIRSQPGRLRGLPMAVFAALAWPLLMLAGITLPVSWLLAYRGAGPDTAMPFGALLLLLVPVATLTFAIWAVYAASRWGANKPQSPRRGVLKWVFLGLLLSTVGAFLARDFLGLAAPSTPVETAPIETPGIATEPAATTPWIRFTFTAVELREVAGVRWLAIDYVDDVHGNCQKSFPWETTIPGFKAETRTTEFVKEDKDSPSVRHQRIEYRMPDSSPREQLERLRDNLEKALKQKSFRLELGENEVPLMLFELPGAEGGSLQARIKVVPPMKIPVNPSTTSNSATGSIALTITRATIEPENRKLRVLFDLDESPALGIKADATTIIKKRGVEFPAPVPGTVTQVDGRSHVAEWVLPEIFDASRLTNAQWQVNFNQASQRYQKSLDQVVTLVVLGQYATVGREDDWEYQILLRAVPLKRSSLKNEDPAASPSAMAPPAQNHSFGPVVVRTLPFNDSLQDGFLDLRTGRLLTPPKDIAALFKTAYGKRMEWERKSDPRAAKMREWLQSSGANLMAYGGEYGERLEMREGVALAPTVISNDVVVPFGFEQADAHYLATRILRSLVSSEKQRERTKTIGQLQPGFDTQLNTRQDSFCFRTREGTVGILQILNTEDNPRGVKIRYKLVQSPTAEQP